MKVISLPGPLGRSVALLFLGVPLAALETVLFLRASWWRLPLQQLGIVAGISFVLLSILAFGLARGKAWGFPLAVSLAAGWCSGTAWAAVVLKSPTLGFLGVFLLLFSFLLLLSLRRELGKSYFDPGVRWFQGVPRPISFLKCRVNAPSGAAELRVSRLDGEGAFLFGEPGQPLGATAIDELVAGGSREQHELVFEFRDRQVHCRGVPMRYFRRSATGAGFRFQALSLDGRKQLGDFIETLRGEGYVE